MFILPQLIFFNHKEYNVIKVTMEIYKIRNETSINEK